MKLLTKQKQMHRHRKQTYGYQMVWQREINQDFAVHLKLTQHCKLTILQKKMWKLYMLYFDYCLELNTLIQY